MGDFYMEYFDDIENEDYQQVEENDQPISSDELCDQLGILNLSLNTVYILIIALFLVVQYLNMNIIQINDAINNTNYSESFEGFEKITNITGVMYIYSTGIFLWINLNNYSKLLQNKDNVSQEELSSAYTNAVGSILVFCGILISFDFD